MYAAAAAKLLQSCPTLCNSIDDSLPGSTVPGILQAKTLEWVAISFSNAWKWKVKVRSLSRVWLFATPWTVAHQAFRPWDFPGKSTGVGCHCLLRTYVYAAAKSLQSCLTLCNPRDGSPPGSPVPGILKARYSVIEPKQWTFLWYCFFHFKNICLVIFIVLFLYWYFPSLYSFQYKL